jgi:hypothetical protein
MIARMPNDSDDRATTRKAWTYVCCTAAPAATIIDVVMPGTLARAAEPSGSALKRAGRDDSGSPAPVAAAGISLAAQLD